MPTPLPEPSAERTVSFGRIMAGALGVMRRRFWFYLALVIVANLPVYVAAFPLGNQYGGEPVKPEELPTLLVGLTVYILLGPLVGALFAPDANAAALTAVFGAIALLSSYVSLGAVAHAIAAEEDGHPATLSGALAATLRRGPVLLGVGLGADLIRILATPFLLAPGFIVLCVLSVALQACVVEKLGVRESLMRSVALTRGQIWTVLAVILLIVPLVAASELAVMVAPGLDPASLVALRIVTSIVAATISNVIGGVLFLRLRAAEGPADRVARVFA